MSQFLKKRKIIVIIILILVAIIEIWLIIEAAGRIIVN